ncbi:MAG: diacylglycerol kinase family protein [Trueperaceae bacterium]|nr:MAG: diacylglycerol kinase family protein [Trueperaceae bacterium]
MAFGGLAWAWRSQPNFRIEVSIGTLAIALGAWLSVNLVPILLCCSIVLSLELINTAIEATVDLASPELHQLAKRAKDFAAAAVLVAVLFSTLVGLIALGPPLIARIASSL